MFEYLGMAALLESIIIFNAWIYWEVTRNDQVESQRTNSEQGATMVVVNFMFFGKQSTGEDEVAEVIGEVVGGNFHSGEDMA